ncbi:MAG: 4Fe-4S binding protein [Methanoregula sp.]
MVPKGDTRQTIRRIILFVFFIAYPIIIVFLSPILAVPAAGERIMAAGLLIWMILLILSFFIGRVYCGWVCPGGSEQMIVDRLIRKPLVQIRYLSGVRWIFLALWLGLTIILAIRAGGLTSIDPFYKISGFPYGIMMVLYGYSMIIMVFLSALFLGKRGMCQYLCPTSGLMMIGTRVKNYLKYPSLHIEADKDLCVDCKKCEENCPRSLEVTSMVRKGSFTSDECILCGTCIDTCPRNVTRFAWLWRR